MISRFSGLRFALLEYFVDDPPTAGTDRWFGDDMLALSLADLREERLRLQGRLRLTPRIDRDRWPGSWVSARLQKCEDILRDRR